MSYDDPYGEMGDPRSVPTGRSRRTNGPRQSGPRQPRGKPDLGSYVEVKDRIKVFYARYPDGRIQSEIIGEFTRIDRIDHKIVPAQGDKGEKHVRYVVGMVAVKAYAYRTPDDPRPATGMSAMLMPGTTPYTEGSELENAETSAWGRALANLDILNDHSIASRDEVRNARGDDDVDAEIAAAEAFAQSQAAAPDPTAQAAQILDAVPVAPEAPPLAGEPAAAPEGATDTPAATEAKGEAPPAGLDVDAFLVQIRAHFIHSSIINKTRIALWPESKSYKDLTDLQRLILLDGCLESIRQDTKE